MPRRATLAACAVAALAGSASADAVSASGVLLITLEDGNHEVTLTIDDGRVELDGVPGVAPGAAFTGIEQVNCVSARGANAFLVLLSTDRDLALSFDAERGGTTIEVIGDANGAAVNLDLDVILGPGSDTITLDLDSTAASLSVSIDLNTGAGAAWFSGSIDSPLPTATMDLALTGTLSGGSDTLHLDATSAATSPGVLFDLRTGGGADDVGITLTQLVPASIQALGTIDLGNGPDTLALTLGGPGCTTTMLGQVRGQNSADSATVAVTGNLMTLFRMLGGNGPDTVTTTATGSIAGTPLISGGKAWDTLTIAAGGAQLGIPLVNGGPGYDTATGFGTIEECEVVNP